MITERISKLDDVERERERERESTYISQEVHRCIFFIIIVIMDILPILSKL